MPLAKYMGIPMTVPPGQMRLLLAAIHLTQRRGYAPSFRDLSAATGITSLNGVECHLVALRRKGLIAQEPRSGRTLRLTVRFIPADRLVARPQGEE